MSRIGAKTYSRKQECKTSLRFDQLLADKSNKPSTAKVSMTALHRWGVTSFTSLRKAHVNGQKNLPEKTDNAKRIKLETPPNSQEDDPFSFDGDPDGGSRKAGLQPPLHPTSLTQGVKGDASKQEIVVPVKPRKFFKTGSTRVFTAETDCILPSQLNPKLFDSFQRLEKPGKPLTLADFTRGTNLANSQGCFQKVQNQQECNQTSAESDLQLPQTPQGNLFTDETEYPINYQPSSSTQSVTATTSANASDSQTTHNSVPSSPQDDEESQLSDRVLRSGAPRVYSRKPNVDLSVKSVDVPASLVSPSPSLPSSQPSVLDSQLDDVSDPLQLQTTKPDMNASNYSSSPVWSSSSQSPKPHNSSSDNGQGGDHSDSTEVTKDGESVAQEYESAKTQQAGNKMRRIFNSSNKPKVKYNHRHWQNQIKEEEDELQEDDALRVSLADEFEDDLVEEDLSLKKEVHHSEKFPGESRTSYKCARKAKELYTVIRNVKQAHQCHESGETQEFNDDVEYLLDGIQPENNSGTRCLSIISFATKCMVPSFRVHLRAHGIIPKIFSALMDAPSDLNVSLCTATLMFVLSQDRLTMDLESSTLSLMLQLLESDQSGDSNVAHGSDQLDHLPSSTSSDKNLEKVRQICEQMQQKGHAHHLNLDNINTGTLAMETLLSLTSRKAGEWFKEELRSLGGLDHIVDTVNSCSEGINPTKLEEHPTKFQLDNLQKIDRCLRVLENVTYMNTENQTYLLNYDKASLVVSCVRLLSYCRGNLMYHPMVPPEDDADVPAVCLDGPGSIFFSLLLSLLKVLVNLTQNTVMGSKIVGSQKDLLGSVLLCILQAPRCVPVDQRFDLIVLALGLLINLVEHSEENRAQLIVSQTVGSFDCENDGGELTGLEALVEVFFARQEAAKQSEEQADALLSSQEMSNTNDNKNTPESSQQHSSQASSQTSQVEALEETLMKALQKAGKHMEHSIIGAYIALLLGCVIQNNEDYTNVLRDHMPDGSFEVLIEVLKKFHSFVNLTGCISNTGAKSIQHVIDVFESS